MQTSEYNFAEERGDSFSSFLLAEKQHEEHELMRELFSSLMINAYLYRSNNDYAVTDNRRFNQIARRASAQSFSLLPSSGSKPR